MVQYANKRDLAATWPSVKRCSEYVRHGATYIRHDFLRQAEDISCLYSCRQPQQFTARPYRVCFMELYQSINITSVRPYTYIILNLFFENTNNPQSLHVTIKPYNLSLERTKKYLATFKHFREFSIGSLTTESMIFCSKKISLEGKDTSL